MTVRLIYFHGNSEFIGRKFRIHWPRPSIIKEITDSDVVQLVKLNGDPFPGKVNGS